MDKRNRLAPGSLPGQLINFLLNLAWAVVFTSYIFLQADDELKKIWQVSCDCQRKMLYCKQRKGATDRRSALRTF